MADNKNKQSSNPGQQTPGDDAAAAAKRAEEAELEMLKEEAEKAAAAAAENKSSSPDIGEAGMITTASRPATPTVVGDIEVQCIRSCNFVSLGSRHYVFVAGKKIKMDPSHALEMEQSGWVVAKK